MDDLKRVYAALTEEITLDEQDHLDKKGVENILRSRDPGKITG